MTNAAHELWDEREVLITVIDELLHSPRDPLTASAVHPTQPGLYLVLYTGPTWWFRRVADASWPLYCGSAAGLRRRLRRHALKAQRVEFLDPDDLWAVTAPMPSHAAAVYTEALALSQLRPVLNEAWVAGFGSQAVGAGRSAQSPSAFSRLHPPMKSGTTDRTVASSLAEAVEKHLEASVPAGGGWSPMTPRRE